MISVYTENNLKRKCILYSINIKLIERRGYMSNRVCAKLNNGIDSFLRVTNTIRRKEINVKSISMILNDDENIDLDIVIDDINYCVNDLIKQISKLVDVEEIKEI
jgi:acetolactate synthase regulatory subunit